MADKTNSELKKEKSLGKKIISIYAVTKPIDQMLIFVIPFAQILYAKFHESAKVFKVLFIVFAVIMVTYHLLFIIIEGYCTKRFKRELEITETFRDTFYNALGCFNNLDSKYVNFCVDAANMIEEGKFRFKSEWRAKNYFDDIVTTLHGEVASYTNCKDFEILISLRKNDKQFEILSYAPVENVPRKFRDFYDISNDVDDRSDQRCYAAFLKEPFSHKVCCNSIRVAFELKTSKYENYIYVPIVVNADKKNPDMIGLIEVFSIKGNPLGKDDSELIDVAEKVICPFSNRISLLCGIEKLINSKDKTVPSGGDGGPVEPDKPDKEHEIERSEKESGIVAFQSAIADRIVNVDFFDYLRSMFTLKNSKKVVKEAVDKDSYEKFVSATNEMLEEISKNKSDKEAFKKLLIEFIKASYGIKGTDSNSKDSFERLTLWSKARHTFYRSPLMLKENKKLIIPEEDSTDVVVSEMIRIIESKTRSNPLKGVTPQEWKSLAEIARKAAEKNDNATTEKSVQVTSHI